MIPTLIMCAGDGTRIGLDHPKCLISVNGETLLARTVRLLAGHDVKPFVFARREDFGFFERMRFSHFSIPENRGGSLTQSIAEAISHVPKSELVRVLLGDVCWSPLALSEVVRDKPSYQAPYLILREGPNKVSGKPYGEKFGIVARREFLESCSLMGTLEKVGETFPGVVQRAVKISEWDYTEDFDFPHDLTNLIPNIERAMAKERP